MYIIYNIQYIIYIYIICIYIYKTKTYVKPEAGITVFELLMMGGVSSETC